MNEEQVLEVIKDRTDLSDDQVDMVNEIIEENLDITDDANGRETIIGKIKEKLGFGDDRASEIYRTVMGVLGEGIAKRVQEMLVSEEGEETA
ncbi:MAG: hypothetical protein K6F57_03940 [Candidatus Saccharibacteria bacterium]|nr:hypothetical protein [Candidatus Saccharibacteria bacterium]